MFAINITKCKKTLNCHPWAVTAKFQNKSTQVVFIDRNKVNLTWPYAYRGKHSLHHMKISSERAENVTIIMEHTK